MIYHPYSSQDVIHCGTGYKSLAVLKVKVIVVPFFYFRSVLFSDFLNYILLVMGQSPKYKSKC